LSCFLHHFMPIYPAYPLNARRLFHLQRTRIGDTP
jgi:hypothetical protein